MDIHGVVEFEIDGKKRGLRNDQYALLIACRKEGGSFQDMLDRVNANDTLSFVHLLYGLAVSYAESKNQRIDFTVNDVGSWIEKVGPAKMREYLTELFKTPEVPKNSLSPQETGVPTS